MRTGLDSATHRDAQQAPRTRRASRDPTRKKYCGGLLDVLEEVRTERVGEPRDNCARPVDTEGPGKVADACRGSEQQAAHPQPLGHPHRHANLSEHPVEGALWEQVPDVLVGHGAGCHRRIPHRDRRAEEPARVEIQILLGVVARTPGLVASRGMYAKAARRAFSNAR